jgi:peptide/nickel transport system substrate-binding protein
MKDLYPKVKLLIPLLVILSMVVSGCAAATPTAAPIQTQPPATEAATAEPTAEPTPPPTADELIIAIPEDVSNYDPYYSQGDMHTPAIFKMLYDNLIERDSTGKLVPGLATSWNWTDDKTLELNLREGVKFHNGEAFDSSDVVYSVNRILGVPGGAAYQSIESIEAVGANKVIIHMKQVDSQLIHNLTTFLSILPKDTFEQEGAEAYADHPIGTGPYMWAEHQRDQYLKMTAYPDYFDGSYKGKAIVPNLTFRFIPELATRLAELQAGTIDIAVGVENDKVAEVEEGEGTHVVTAEGMAYYMMPFAFKAGVDAPFNDIKVREALAYATDVQAVLDALAGGYGTVLAGPFTSVTTGYDPNLKPWPYDKAKALDLLAQAGYSNGFELTIDVASSVPTDVVMAIAGQWAEVGVTLNVNPMEVGKFNELWLSKQNHDMVAVGINAEVEPGSFKYIWTCDGAISYYCNQDFEDAYNLGVSLLDDTERAAAFQKAYQVLHDDVPAIYLWSSSVHWGVSDKVTTFAYDPDGSLMPSLMNKVK